MVPSSRIAETDLLEAGGPGLRAWVEAVVAGRASAPDDFNWLGVAQVAALHANTSLSDGHDEIAIDWARAAVAIYDRLSREKPGIKSNARDSMFLRTRMVRRFGPHEGDLLLDPDIVTAWFLDNAGFARDDAHAMAECWRQLKRTEIAKLREIKNMILVLRIWDEAGLIEVGSDLASWIALAPLLP